MTEAGLWLCDVNVLVALGLTTHLHHRPAHAALSGHAGTWATCPTTENALLRLMLNPAVTGRRFSAPDVLELLRGMRADPRWRWLPEDVSLATPTVDTSVLQGHQQVTDLHLVHLAAACDAVLVTFDASLLAALAPADRRHVSVLPQ